MSLLDPWDGACPAQHPQGLGGCSRGQKHKGWHATKDGKYFEVPHECETCCRTMDPVLSIGGEIIARRCGLCGKIGKP